MDRMGVVRHVERVNAETLLGVVGGAGREEQRRVVIGTLVAGGVDVALDSETA